MNAQSSFLCPSRRRALVLGGGGSTGNAWLIGVLAGLSEAGVNPTVADLIVGTSAGSTAAAQIASASPRELLAAALVPVSAPQRRSPSLDAVAKGVANPVEDHLQRIRGIIASSTDLVDMRRRMGAAALHIAATSDDSWQEHWRRTVAMRLPALGWPEQSLAITAVEAENGTPVVFDRHSGVELADAVAASCSSGRPYRIRDEYYIDGGYRTNADNADLASGYGRVLILSPFGGQSLLPAGWGAHLDEQMRELRKSGSRVEAVFPDSGSAHLFGANALNPTLRPPAAQAGYERGLAAASTVNALWGD